MLAELPSTDQIFTETSRLVPLIEKHFIHGETEILLSTFHGGKKPTRICYSTKNLLTLSRDQTFHQFEGKKKTNKM